jgi:putative tricarboxylic transport membrane protein
VTALEGNMMAKRGRAGPALATSAIGSFVAGTIATILLTVMAPIVVDFALKFGPAEYFAVMVLAFTTVSAVLGASPTRGLASLFFGLAIGLIGLDSQTGQARFTLGIPELLDGIDVVVVAVGLFAVGETLYIATYLNREEDRLETMKGSIWMSRADWGRSWKPWLRGTALGFPFGTIPAGGAEIRRSSPTRSRRSFEESEEFGKGAIEGVAGPEAAEQCVGHRDARAALARSDCRRRRRRRSSSPAFQQWGLQPGPSCSRRSRS